jgi:hypothetical protein
LPDGGVAGDGGVTVGGVVVGGVVAGGVGDGFGDRFGVVCVVELV